MRRLTSIATKWLALTLAFCLAFPANGLSVYADAKTSVTEDVVSANTIKGSEVEDVEAEEAVIETVHPLTFGEETTLTDLGPVETYKLLVTIPEGENGEAEYDYYRLTVDGKTVNYFEAYVADSFMYGSFGVAYMQPGTYTLRVTNDMASEHVVCFEKANISSLEGELNNPVHVKGSHYDPATEGIQLTIHFEDGTSETWDTSKITNFSVSNCYTWDAENGTEYEDLVSGTTYTLGYSVFKTDLKVQCTIADNLITSIAFKEDQSVRTVYENGYYNTDSELQMDDDEVFVVTEDGEEKEYTYKELKSMYGADMGVLSVYTDGEFKYSSSFDANASYNKGAGSIVPLTGIEDDADITGYVVVGSAYCAFPVKLVRNPVESIAIQQLPYKTTYAEGESKVNLSGLELLVTYDDSSTEVLSYDDEDLFYSEETRFCLNSYFSGNSLAYLEAGEYEYTFSYAGCSVSTTFTIEANNIKEITLLSGAEGFVYTEGERSNLNITNTSELCVQVTYNDDTSSTGYYRHNGWWTNNNPLFANILDSDDQMELDCSEVDFNTAGSYMAYLVYRGVQAEIPVLITESNIDTVELDTSGMRKIYAYGENTSFASYGSFTANVTYKDGTSRSFQSYELSADYFAYAQNETGTWSKVYQAKDFEIGTHKVYIKVFARTFSYDIEIVENPVESVTLISGETQTAVEGVVKSAAGDGLTIQVSYKDETIEDKIVTITDNYVRIDDENWPGGVTYADSTVRHSESGSSSHVGDINAFPVGTYRATLYVYGYALDYTYVITETPVESISFTVPEGYNRYVAGGNGWVTAGNMNATIAVTYKDANIGTKYFSMIESWQDPDYSSSYISATSEVVRKVGESTGMYSNAVSDLEVGEYELEITAYGKTASIPFSVVENPVSSVMYTPATGNQSFQEGNSYSLWNDGTVAVTYKDGTSAIYGMDEGGWIDPKISLVARQTLGDSYIKDEEGNRVHDTTSLVPGVYEAVVYIYGIPATFNVTVTANPVESIEVTGYTDTIVQGTEMSLYNMVNKIKINKTDGTFAECEVDGGEFYYEETDDWEYISVSFVTEEENDYEDEDTGSLSAGTHTVKVSCLGRSATFALKVVENPIQGISITVPDSKKTYMVGRYTEMTNEGMKITVDYRDPAVADKVITCDGHTSWTDSLYPGNVTFSQSFIYDDGECDCRANDAVYEDVPVGTYTVTVRAYGCTATYDIEVVAPEIKGISVDATNWEKTFISGSRDQMTYNTEDITVTFPNGTSKALYDIIFEKYENIYGSGYEETDDYDTYMNNLKRYLINADGERIDYNNWQSFRNIPVGTYQSVIDLFGHTASYEIEVVESNIAELTISKYPDDMTYLDWGRAEPNLTGMELTITYKDDTQAKTVTFDKEVFEDDDGCGWYTYVDGRMLSISTEDFKSEGVIIRYVDKEISFELTKGLPSIEGASTIYADKPVLTRIVNAGEYGYYKFTPNENGAYNIYSVSDEDTYGGIFTVDGSRVSDDDDNGEGNNYYMSVPLLAGQTYYIISQYLGRETTGNFSTVVTKQEKLVVKEKQKITDVKLKIDNPKAGGKKPKWHEVTDASGGDTYMITDVTWTTLDDEDQNGKFKPGKAYEVEIVLTPLEDHKFTTDTKISVNTKKPTYRRIESNGTLTLRFTFGKTNCKVNIPESEDYTMVPHPDNPEYFDKDTPCRFKITPKNGKDRVIVKRNGIIIKPDEEGYYNIEDIEDNVDVAVSVKEPEVTVDTVFVNYYDGEELYDKIVVKKDASIYNGSEEKELPLLASYTDDSNQFFLGWYDDNGKRYTRNTVITAETTLHAKWTDGIFTQTANGMLVTYKMISVTDTGKIRLQISSVQAKSAAVELNAVSFLRELFSAEGSGDDGFTIPSSADLSELGDDMESEVISVAAGAFAGNTEITKVTVPSTVESIGEGAFSGCTSLTEVALDEGVKEVGANAFEGCSELTQVTLPETVTTIGDAAFKDSGLTQITLPDSLEEIGEDAFAKTTPEGEEEKPVEVFCSETLLAYVDEEVLNNAGAKVTSLNLVINHDYHEIALDYKGDAITVSANAIKDEVDVSNEITWSMDESGKSYVQIEDLGGGKVKIAPIQVTKEPVTLTAKYGEKKANLDVIVKPLTVCDEDVVITLDQGEYDYTGTDIVPIVMSVTIDGEVIPESEYTTDYSNRYYGATGNGYAYVYFKNYKVNVWDEDDGDYVLRDHMHKDYTINMPQVESVSVSKTSLTMKPGESQTITATVAPDIVYNKNVNWSSDNEVVATVENGKIMAKAVGTAVIKAVSQQDRSTYATCVVTVSDKTTPAHTCSFGAAKIVKASPAKNGSVTQTCSGCGAVKTQSTIFAPKTVELSKTDFTYSGKECKPSVKVLDSAGAVVAAANYTVAYSNNKKIGQATVTVTFKGDKYEGSMKQTFNVNPKTTKVSKLKASKKKIKVTWKKVKKDVSGYQIQYSTSKSFEDAKIVTVKGAKKSSKTISKLKSKKKYYVRIRTYKTVSGTKYYSEWSKAKKVKVK